MVNFFYVVKPIIPAFDNWSIQFLHVFARLWLLMTV